MNRSQTLVLVLGLAAGLSACGGGDDEVGTTVPVVPAAAAKVEDQFGAGFGTRFRVAADTDSTDPVAADLGPLSLTTDPVTI